MAALLLCTSGEDHRSLLDEIQQRGSMILITRNGASSYFLGPDGGAGPEYELAAAFADFLNVELKVEVAEAFSQLETLLAKHQGDFIGANLSHTPQREKVFKFSPAYDSVVTEVIYRRGSKRPRDMTGLIGQRVAVIAGSSYEDILKAAKEEIPELRWTSMDNVGMEDIFQGISDGEIDITLVDSNIFKINQQYFPHIRLGFSLENDTALAWAFRRNNDDSLLQSAREFFSAANEQGILVALHDKYYEHLDDFDQVGMFHFMEQVRERLPSLLPMFQEAANAYNLDWKLLAAMGYQESHWDADARSRTGVRGIMMLTQRTAKQLGVTDREDPEQSIDGGARYLNEMLDRVPDRIQNPDRLWLALAAYNMGWGHVEDARVLTQQQGGNPDSWKDVNRSLPLLSQEKWYRQTRYGYARGFEAERYVRNIRNYYDILKWMDTRDHPLLAAQLESTLPTPAPATDIPLPVAE